MEDRSLCKTNQLTFKKNLLGGKCTANFLSGFADVAMEILLIAFASTGLFPSVTAAGALVATV